MYTFIYFVGTDRLPVPSDKDYLPYVNATLHEIMRFRNVLPLGVPHAARFDCKLGVCCFFSFSKVYYARYQ